MINYPTYLHECVICDDKLDFHPAYAPSSDWEETVERRLREQPDAPPPPASMYPHRANAEANVFEENGQLFVYHQELLDNGYRNIAPDTVVYLNDRFYECQSYIRKRQVWWVKPIDPEAEFADVPVLSEEPERQWRDGGG